MTSTKNYSYSNSAWGDLLTFDGRNYITYDEIGNPTRIYQDDGGFLYGYELTWEGRQLTAYTYFEEEGSYEYYDTPTTYTYNADGIRTSKTTDVGTKYEYLLDGSRIVSQTWGDNIFVFIYDENGSPIGINYTTAEHSALDTFQSYYFEKNLQGDIVAIYNSSGVKIGSYTYDAWGNVTTNHHTSNSTESFVVTNNPFRYRGYYYDSDTGFYYLQTRYYNPANGRFLNADTYLSTGEDILGYNMFAYCNNNPMMFVDDSGTFPILTAVLIFVAVCATANDVYQIASGDVHVGEVTSDDVDPDNNNVKVENSHKVITPWVQYGYSFYLNHFKKETKDVIKGTTSGIQYEWALHNVAYGFGTIVGSESIAGPASPVDVGKTIYNDRHDKGMAKVFSVTMKVLYSCTHPIEGIVDGFISLYD